MTSKSRIYLILSIISLSLFTLSSCSLSSQWESSNGQPNQRDNSTSSLSSPGIEAKPANNSVGSGSVPTSSAPSPAPATSQNPVVLGPSPTPTPTVGTTSASLSNNNRKQSKIQTDLFKYLSDSNNQESVKNRAKELNNGDQHNSCVYFASEALRRVGMDLSIQICNTGKQSNETSPEISFTYQLLRRGWKIEKDLSLLLPGDLCFTTLNSDGISTHVYTFMGWEKDGSTDYAYVCDNQSYDYGTTYHKRNVRIALTNKEAFLYFMYKPET